MPDTLRVRGYSELARALRLFPAELKLGTRERLREVAKLVRADAATRFARIDVASAAGYRVALRTRGVSVEQRLPRRTGQRPDYGALQMRIALGPAADDNAAKVQESIEELLDYLAVRHF